VSDSALNRSVTPVHKANHSYAKTNKLIWSRIE